MREGASRTEGFLGKERSMSQLRGFLVALAALTLTAPAAAQVSVWSAETTGLAYAPDGKTLFVATQDGIIHLWDIGRGREYARYRADAEGVNGIALSVDGKLLVSAGVDGKVRLWDARKGTELVVYEGHTKTVIAVALSPDGKTVASGSYDGTVRLWDRATGALRNTLIGHENRVTTVAFSPDGKMLASGGVAGAGLIKPRRSATQADLVRLWDVKSGKELAKLLWRGETLAFHPDGRSLILGGVYANISPLGNGRFTFETGARLVVWDLVRKRERFKLEDYGTAIALSRDGRYLATGFSTRLHLGRPLYTDAPGLRVWETATGKEVLVLPSTESAAVLAFAPDSLKLATGQRDGKVRFWDLAPQGWNPDLAGKVGPRELETHWSKLATHDARKAYEAVWFLAGGGDKTVAFMKERLKPALAVGPEIQKFIADLDHAKFAIRETASRELRGRGPEIEPALREALKGNVSAERQRRIEALLKAADRPPSADQLLPGRALQVLERIGTPAARALLSSLAEGFADAPLTMEARAALGRLSKK
jgi:WD40 repeat protein